jgi:hypothetical protein
MIPREMNTSQRDLSRLMPGPVYPGRLSQVSHVLSVHSSFPKIIYFPQVACILLPFFPLKRVYKFLDHTGFCGSHIYVVWCPSACNKHDPFLLFICLSPTDHFIHLVIEPWEAEGKSPSLTVPSFFWSVHTPVGSAYLALNCPMSQVSLRLQTRWPWVLLVLSSLTTKHPIWTMEWVPRGRDLGSPVMVAQ